MIQVFEASRPSRRTFALAVFFSGLVGLLAGFVIRGL
jgi:hypothetical protein